jgi:DNA primase
MQLDGMTFPEAVTALAEQHGVPIEDETTPAERRQSQQRKQEREQLYGIMRMAADFYERQLEVSGHPLAVLARAELAKRGIGYGAGHEQVDAALRAFHVGYAPYGWDGLKHFLVQQEVSLEMAQRLGLLATRRGGGFYDAFRHRLMFAVSDKTGRVVAFSGRALAEPSEEQVRSAGMRPMGRGDGHEPPKYVNSPESPIYVKGENVFGLYEARSSIRQQQEAVVVEGNFDVLSLHARGFTRVVAPLGTAFTTSQARLIKRYAPTMVIMFDGDKAGRKATEGARLPAREAGLAVKVGRMPDGSDPDDMARDKGIEAVKTIAKNAQDMLEYLIDSALIGPEKRGASLRERHEGIRRVMGYLGEENDPTLRAMAKAYADKLSSQLVVAGSSPNDIRSLEKMVQGALRGGENRSAEGSDQKGASARGPNSRSLVEPKRVGLSILGALLDYPELLAEDDIRGALAHASGDLAMAVYAIQSMWEGKKALEGGQLLDFIPKAVHAFASHRLASPVCNTLKDARVELLENAKKLQWLALKEDNATKLEELAEAARVGNTAHEDELLRELARRSKKKLGLS